MTRCKLIMSTLITVLVRAVTADYVATIDPATTRTWDGWGTSLAWWANRFGTSNKLADLAFTRKTVVFGGASLPGLGLNIVRYNIGGSSDVCISVVVDSVNSTVCQNMPDSWVDGSARYKKIDGFWQNWFNKDIDSNSWNWTVDYNQRSMLLKAKSRGVDIFEAVSYSPLWWMTYNKATGGSDSSPATDNLQRWNYNDFAYYLASVVEKAARDWGIQFNYVSPFNEPGAWWWTYNKTTGSQEGCAFQVATQVTVLKELANELFKKKLFAVQVTSSDENSPDDSLNTWQAFDSETQQIVRKINTHSYYGLQPYRGAARQTLNTAVVTAGKKLWVSEYGDWDPSGLTLAEIITRDMTAMFTTGWVYWQFVDGPTWGLLIDGNSVTGAPTMKYYVFAHYTRHIRRYMEILTSTDNNTIAAYDPVEAKLVIVAANYNSEGQWISFDLSKFRTVPVGITIPRWCTDTSGASDKYIKRMDTVVQNNKLFLSWFSPKTVQTFEVPSIYR